jgi:hypothetical protein
MRRLVPFVIDLTRLGAHRMGAVLVFTVVVLVAIVSSFDLSRGIRPDSITSATVDFGETVYFPTLAFTDGVNPYDPNYRFRYGLDSRFPPYAPITLLVHLPLTFVPLEVAALIYVALSIVLTVALAYVALRFNNLKVLSAHVLLVAALILLSRPGRQNVLNGQITLEVILGTYVALYFAQRRPLLSGVGLAFALMKPTFGIPLALLMLARRDIRAVLAGTAVAAAINIPLLLVLVKQAGGVATFFRKAFVIANGFQQDVETNAVTSSLRIDFIAFVSRFLGTPLTVAGQFTLSLLVLCMGAYAVSMAMRLERGGTRNLSATIICLTILLCTYHQAYDLLLLTLPLVALAKCRLPAALFSPRHRWGLLLLFAGLAANYASAFDVLERLGLSTEAGRSLPSRRLEWLLLVTLNGAALALLFLSYTVATFRSARNFPHHRVDDLGPRIHSPQSATTANC